MNKGIKNKIALFYKNNPIAIGKKATNSDITIIEKSLNLKLDKCYIDFITNFGGGILGAKEIYALSNSEILGEENVIELNESFKNDSWKGIKNWFIFGTDGSGNPIGIDENGKILSNDHDCGGIYLIAKTFEEYLKNILSEIENV